ncbi:MAG: CoB--CoM heterodisulfide reductase iron-sulfur subunit A family protein [Deltaproteobacteria bacterium]|nr:CoB--CoM heterodisulfide reductase iron-sulfur subunit A family protein [Deltaproteobacteria bacterium]
MSDNSNIIKSFKIIHTYNNANNMVSGTTEGTTEVTENIKESLVPDTDTENYQPTQHINPDGLVNVIICECGPIIKNALNLNALCQILITNPAVRSVQCYGEPCSIQGRKWLVEFLKREPNNPTVIAGCSIREQGVTFANVCKQAEVNPYLLVMANIREQCIFVTPDKDAALKKSTRIIHAAIARACMQEALTERTIPVDCDVLILGSGIAGLTAAKMLANASRKVVLVENSPAIGGRIPMLSELCPNFECASCMLEPLMDEVLHNERVELLTNSNITEVTGFLGNFNIKTISAPRHVNPEGCYGCHSCETACPVEIDNECDFGFSKRKAIYIPYNGALPNVPTIDPKNCLRSKGEDCHACADACPFDNINLQAQAKQHEYRVGAIIVATGFEERPVEIWQEAKSIVTLMACERLLNSAGPTSGEFTINNKTPKHITFVHCIDEQGIGPAKECSKICCLAIGKYIHTIHKKLPNCEMVDLMWERCSGGKGSLSFYDKAISESSTKQILLKPTDTLEGIEQMADGAVVHYRKDGKGQLLETDLVIYAPTLTGVKALQNTASLLRMQLDDQSFVLADHPRLRPFNTRSEGIFAAGAAQGPSDASETSWRAAAAAGAVLSALVPGRELAISPEKAVVDSQLCGACHSCVLTCPYGAISFEESEHTAKVNEVLCRGCGACVAACPSSAITARNFTDQQIQAEIEAGVMT